VRADQILVAESGITSVDDARMLPGVSTAVLVGTALMQADDPGQLIQGISSIRRTVHHDHPDAAGRYGEFGGQYLPRPHAGGRGARGRVARGAGGR